MEKRCDLCGKSDGKVQAYCGGYVLHAHPTCGKIGNKAIELYFMNLMTHPLGLSTLSNMLSQIKNKVYALKKPIKKRRN